MSKLYDTYKSLKSCDKSCIYVFKSGIFYILLDDDAKRVSLCLGLKLTKFNDEILKCGFPISAKDKYFQLLKSHNFIFKISGSPPRPRPPPHGNRFRNNHRPR